MCVFAKMTSIRKRKELGRSLPKRLSATNTQISQQSDMVNTISLGFVIVAIIILAVGWRCTEGKTWIHIMRDSYSEWLGILIDAMLLYFINWVIRREEKEKIINQFSSSSNAFALDAAKRLRKKGWLTDGTLRGNDMTHAKLDNVNLGKAVLENVDFSYASLQDSFLVEANFSNSNFTGADFRNAQCRWANFSNANLRWANLEGAALDGVNFNGADLRFAKLGKYNASTVLMEGALLSQTLTENEIELVQASTQLIRKSPEEFSMAFYRELFKASPATKALFLSNIQDQARKFAQLFGLLVASLKDMEKLLPALQALGKRHIKYGVEEYHYQLVGRALTNTLRKSLGLHFTPEVENAWLKTYELVTLVMIDSARER